MVLTVEHDGISLHGVGEWNELYTDGRRSIREGLYFGWKVLSGLKWFGVGFCSCISSGSSDVLNPFNFYEMFCH